MDDLSVGQIVKGDVTLQGKLIQLIGDGKAIITVPVRTGNAMFIVDNVKGLDAQYSELQRNWFGFR